MSLIAANCDANTLTVASKHPAVKSLDWPFLYQIISNWVFFETVARLQSMAFSRQF